MDNKQVLGALAMDMKRVALGYFRGSTSMANIFFQQALKRKNELKHKDIKPYLVVLLNKMDKIKKEERSKAAEDALFYSTIFQNASTIIS
jgi:hypothetical protein